MKYSYLYVALLLIVCNQPHNALAQQADLQLIPRVNTTTEARETGIATFGVVNRGDTISRPFTVMLWASTDADFSNSPSGGERFSFGDPEYSSFGRGRIDGETVRLAPDNNGFYEGIQPTFRDGNINFWDINFSIRYSIPRPDDVTQSGRLKPLSALLGDSYNYQACIIFLGDEECSIFSQDQSVIVPPAVRLEQVAGDLQNEIQFNWPEVPFDNFIDDSGVAQSVNFVSIYRIRRRDHLGIIYDIELAPSEINRVVVDGEERLSVSFIEGPTLLRGKRNSFAVQSCYDRAELGSSIPDLVCAPRVPSRPNFGDTRRVAALERLFPASIGTLNESIQISWEESVPNARRYQITRCESEQTGNCKTFEVAGALNSYLDSNVFRGRGYTYSISACDRLFDNPNNSNDEKNGQCFPDGNFIYKFGQTNIGLAGLADRYEDDDTPEQATVVFNSVSQLHSFDSNIDDDWLKISLKRADKLVIETAAFDTKLVDTVLRLYDENLTLILENDDKDRENNPGGFSKIETEILGAGNYFLLATHFKLPGGEVLAPTADNYLLNVEFLDKKINITPIILLLLEDD